MKPDAPKYRVWPPIALGVPLVAGFALTTAVGDPVTLSTAVRPVGWVLAVAFALWNGWALVLMARTRTALLPGDTTTRLLANGPFRVSRNPLYLGLIALDIGIALLWPSFWALALVPAGVLTLAWGAIGPEERYLRARFGAEYEEYARRVRRWL
ncbi:isoprenylcysteine carboxylmethyltransferase family protein [Streptomyces sp. NPDC001795]|uniref:methyltransferase family protein n=1 Tax=unclassified Streptomyces TaxID=2593676 RepID=UPI0033270F56